MSDFNKADFDREVRLSFKTSIISLALILQDEGNKEALLARLKEDIEDPKDLEIAQDIIEENYKEIKDLAENYEVDSLKETLRSLEKIENSSN